MDKKQFPKGVRLNGSGIQIRFKLKGDKNYTHEQLEWSQAPANINKAGKLRQEIKDAIRHGVFRYAEFFPDSPRAYETQINTFAHYAQGWLDSPINDWTPQTRYKFKGILNRVWMASLDEKLIHVITHTDLTQALSDSISEFVDKYNKEPSKSLYNDWLTCIRGTFEIAVQDKAVKRVNNPAAELKNKKRDKSEPDPFEIEEADLIIADIYKNDGEMWGAWYELGFYSGMRYPSEPTALLWENVSLKNSEFKVTQIYSKHAKDKIQKTTKTGYSRTVIMNTRSLHAFKVLRKLTGLKSSFVFLQDDEMLIPSKATHAIWRASLKRLGLRYRDPYTMRHTYATIGLMSGANPAFMAKQLGHSTEEFFKTYTTWIERISRDFQMNLIESGIKSGLKVAKKIAENDN